MARSLVSHEEARGRPSVATQPKGKKELWQEIRFHSGMMRGFLSDDSVMSCGTRPSVTMIKFEAEGQSLTLSLHREGWPDFQNFREPPDEVEVERCRWAQRKPR